MTFKRQFEDGFQGSLRVEVTDFDSDDGTYLVSVYNPDSTEGALEIWVSEGALVNPEDRPIGRGDYVRPKHGKQLGQVIAIKKGQCWIDWAPFEPDVSANGSSPINVLVLASNEEIVDARRKGEVSSQREAAEAR